MVGVWVFWAKRSSQLVGMLCFVLGEEDADMRQQRVPDLHEQPQNGLTVEELGF